MGFYAVSTTPLINSSTTAENSLSPCKKIWYADDAAGSGTLEGVKSWWSKIQKQGPIFGYFPNPSKTWLITKPEHLERAKKMFPGINITDEGHKYLGSYIGNEEGMSKFMDERLKEWISDIDDLAKIAKTEPQLVHAAYVYGTSKKWAFVCRTTPNVSEYI